MSRIERSVGDVVNIELLALVATEQPLLVSGMPLRIFHPTSQEEDTFFVDCRQISEEVLFPPFRVFMQSLPRNKHQYVPECYLPTGEEEGYPVIQGFMLDGSEVVLGIRATLGFSAKAVQQQVE